MKWFGFVVSFMIGVVFGVFTYGFIKGLDETEDDIYEDE